MITIYSGKFHCSEEGCGDFVANNPEIEAKLHLIEHTLARIEFKIDQIK